MEIRFHKQLYRTGISDRKWNSLKKKIQKKSLKLDVFLVTFPLGEDGLLEVYWYPELLQKPYQNLKKDVTVIGIAFSRDDAFQLIEQIVSDVGVSDGNILIQEYFKECE